MPSQRKPPTQRTPKGKEIPVPKKADVLDALKRAAAAKPDDSGRRPKK